MNSFFTRFFFNCTIVSALCLCIISCKKDSFITSGDARLGTSVDSLTFDTVFTSIGSVTQSFKINNLNDKKLLLSSVKLLGGSSSVYKININGIASSEASNIEIAAEDSMYVFVTVRINPNLDNLPFVVRDTVQIEFNGRVKKIGLEAYGQNANFLRGNIITSNRTFTNNLPYVILGGLRVDTNVTLTVNPGCRIYVHANAPIIIDGTLLVNGTNENRITFAGDRLDEGYRDLPSSWPGVYFRNSSKNNVIKFGVIKNAYQAIVLEGPADNSNPKLFMQQSIIDNAYDAGILSVGSSIRANNSLISNCGSNVNIVAGGDYEFTNCTVASYSVFIPHKKPVLSVANYVLANGQPLVLNLQAAFKNCIFWGESGFVKDEIQAYKQAGADFNVSFLNCIYKAETDPLNTTITACIKNQNPIFDSVNTSKNIFDFRTGNPLAPGLQSGAPVSFQKDLNDNSRNMLMPDIGCYERQ